MRASTALSTSFQVLKLTFSFPGILVGFYTKRRRAVRRFKMEMIACGIPPVEAKELSEMYNIGIRDLLKRVRGVSEA